MVTKQHAEAAAFASSPDLKVDGEACRMQAVLRVVAPAKHQGQLESSRIKSNFVLWARNGLSSSLVVEVLGSKSKVRGDCTWVWWLQ